MITYGLTNKAMQLMKTKEIDGIQYVRMDVDEQGKEYWIKMFHELPEKCSRCSYSGGALEHHHIHGRKNSDETILLCANCHTEIHSGAI